MKLRAIETAFACAFLTFSGFTLAADQPADSSIQSTQGAQSTPAADEAKKDESAGSGSTSATKADKSFTHGESARCESLTGADKDQCDKEEATKTEGSAAQDMSKPE
jgi:hypothetical protein